MTDQTDWRLPGPEPTVDRSVSGRIIPVCEPDLRGRETEYVTNAVSSGWISSRGRYVEQFELGFATRVGAKWGVAINSGTSALHLALAAANVGPGDEVIVPTFTMVATANAVLYLGAKPVFVDCDDYYQISVPEVENAITSRTKLIVPVHIYGHPSDIHEIDALADEYGIDVVYDAAEAHGSLYLERPIGSAGKASTYSFYGNKTLTTGEGGMIVSNDRIFAEMCRNMRDMCFSADRHFWHKRLGYNFRMTNMQAAVGCAQLERFDELVRARCRNRRHYEELVKAAGLQDCFRFQPQESHVTSSHWMIGIEVNAEAYGHSRDAVRKILAKNGVETRSYFIPMHLQPLYRKDWTGREFPQADHLCSVGLYLPSSSLLTDEDRKYVVDVLAEYRGKDFS